jgi:hypothetical protein
MNMAVKKTAAKKAAKECSLEQRFWLCDGQVFSNLSQLEAALSKMNEGVWKFHVNCKKNDFANWIEDVFGEKSLGKAVRLSKNAKAAAKTVKGKAAGAKLWSMF